MLSFSIRTYVFIPFEITAAVKNPGTRPFALLALLLFKPPL